MHRFLYTKFLKNAILCLLYQVWGRQPCGESEKGGYGTEKLNEANFVCKAHNVSCLLRVLVFQTRFAATSHALRGSAAISPSPFPREPLTSCGQLNRRGTLFRGSDGVDIPA